MLALLDAWSSNARAASVRIGHACVSFFAWKRHSQHDCAGARSLSDSYGRGAVWMCDWFVDVSRAYWDGDCVALCCKRAAHCVWWNVGHDSCHPLRGLNTARVV